MFLALYKLGRLPEAEAWFGLLAQRFPGLALAQFDLGVVRLERGHPEEALDSLNRAISLDPNLLGAWVQVPRALFALGRPAEAEEKARKALKIWPREAALYSELGKALTVQGKNDEAEAAFEKARALGRDSTEKAAERPL